MYTNGILTRGGDFSALEGGMGGLGGTMDQRITAHPFYQKFFPTLDNTELAQYAESAIAVSGADGEGSQIMHFDTLIYGGVVGTEAGSNMFRDWKLDTCGGWMWQVAKTMEQSANLTDAKRWWSGGGNASAGYPGLVPAVVAFMRSQIQSTQYAIPTGPNTFDDFWHPPLDAYAGSTYPLFLDSARRIAAAVGNTSAASALNALIAEASIDFGMFVLFFIPFTHVCRRRMIRILLTVDSLPLVYLQTYHHHRCTRSCVFIYRYILNEFC